MTETLSTIVRPVLTAEQEKDLILAIQDPSTPAGKREDAWETLLAAHRKVIRKAARQTTGLDFEDAEAEALTVFCETVRTFDVAGTARLGTKAYGMIVNKVSDYARRASAPINIPKTVFWDYRKVMKAAGGDITTAYALARQGDQPISAPTLLAIHRAAGDHYDADVVLMQGGEGLMVGRDKSWTPGEAHSEVDLESIETLFAQVSEEQAAVLRTAYGFDTAYVESLREAGTLQSGNGSAIMSDRLVSDRTGLTRQTVERRRKSGIQRMSAFIVQSIESDDI